MPVDQDRQRTAQARRRLIISSLSANFSTDDLFSPVSRLRGAIADGVPRTLVVNSDVDGLTAAMMLASVTNWRIGVLVDKSGYRIAPGPSLNEQLDDTEFGRTLLFGVDVYSTRFPNVSNHPVFFGPNPNGNARLRDLLVPFDKDVASASAVNGAINASEWAGIGAMRNSGVANGMPYKYPLGTAQLMLAALEGAGHAPKFFDRQYLPWLVANCDGGLDTIRDYAWNVEMWWSALAAVVGPASLSEHIYRIATTQRPSEFLDADRRLRYDEPNRSTALDTNWNLVNDSPSTISTFVSMVMDWTGWPDPFADGHESVQLWEQIHPTRSILKTSGMTLKSDDEIRSHLDAARDAIHMGFSSFDNAIRLGWSLADSDAVTEARIPDTLPTTEPLWD